MIQYMLYLGPQGYSSTKPASTIQGWGGCGGGPEQENAFGANMLRAKRVDAIRLKPFLLNMEIPPMIFASSRDRKVYGLM
jgi:hypothetical protein